MPKEKNEKKCTKCGQMKTLNNFYKEKKGRVFSKCKDCCAAYRLKHKERKKKYSYEKWLKDPRHNPEWAATDIVGEDGQIKRKCKKCGTFKKLHFFDKHLECRSGRRAICKDCTSCETKERKKNDPAKHKERAKLNTIKNRYGLSPDNYKKMLKNQDNKCAICTTDMVNPCVDHCHNKNTVRGLLCNNCNSLLGMARDNIKTLNSAISYLERNQ